MIIGLMFVLAFSQTASPAARRGAEDDIREAAFNYMFNQGGPSEYIRSKGIYVSVEDKDPSDDLFKRFAGHKPPVKRLSQSISIEYEGIRDKETGKPGILYYVGEVKWISPDEARVTGSHYVAPLEAGGCNYKVIFEDKKWVVKDCDGPEWISQVSPGTQDNPALKPEGGATSTRKGNTSGGHRSKWRSKRPTILCGGRQGAAHRKPSPCRRAPAESERHMTSSITLRKW